MHYFDQFAKDINKLFWNDTFLTFGKYIEMTPINNLYLSINIYLIFKSLKYRDLWPRIITILRAYCNKL